MSWLSGQEIQDTIRRHGDEATQCAFGGIYSIDTLPFSLTHTPFLMIVNTQAHNLPGEHWISVYIDATKRGEVFDSLALPLSKPLSRWMNRFTRSYTRNRLAYQHPLSDACGAFALYFVLQRLHYPVTLSSSYHRNEAMVRAFYAALNE